MAVFLFKAAKAVFFIAKNERKVENMGMRKYQRNIARARIKAVNAGNVNKKMRKLWRRIIFGDLAKESEAFQTRPRRQGEKLPRKIRPIAKTV